METKPFSSFPFFLDKKGEGKIKPQRDPWWEKLRTRPAAAGLKHEVFTPTIAPYKIGKSRTSLGKHCVYPEQFVS